MTADLTLSNPTQLRLEFSAADREQAWQQSQSFARAGDRWDAYLNRLCLNTVLPWLREDRQLQATVWTNTNALPGFWGLVNGTALTLNTTERLVLLPTETIDRDEWRIPQEWVDIPPWSADYYLAIQVEPEDGWLQMWGYTTHRKLKAQGHYDAGDRTYCLTEPAIMPDLSVLWVARQLGAEPTRAAILPLPAINLAQAENLLTRLGNPSVITPRLEVPFPLWGALVAHDGWRQRLYERRQGLPESRSVRQWLGSSLSTLAQQVGWERLEQQPDLVGARGGENTTSTVLLSRTLVIAGQTYELQISSQGTPDECTWRFTLRNTAPGGVIPSGFKLRLSTEDLQPFEQNEDTATTAIEQLFVEVALAPGEGIVWEVEPIPEGYDREILRF
ncbi:DUF1822 family protein [Stenomitos frigidus]|uniref:DUF1822 domain-containing protein n=1 Tax=Stenomitos frigidus ULC18 TaxID=2107698 RepID=A0A2T1EBG2_9CYAN|nr:DUF1822 family protein [Stenomitos frigidus]PSB30077.1 hypothetical protein C7B82_09925 [Stenomitos frigidus ULC18]